MQSWVENKELRDKYSDLLFRASGGGIDWIDDPPPVELITEDLCIANLDNKPNTLGEIPLFARTQAVCFAAVCISEEALKYVPENLREKVMALKDAITEEQWLDELSVYTGNHLISPPEKLLTREFCRAMVELNGRTIELVPEEFITPELLEIAEKTDDNCMRNLDNRKFPPLVFSGPSIVIGSSFQLLAQKDSEKNDVV